MKWTMTEIKKNKGNQGRKFLGLDINSKWTAIKLFAAIVVMWVLCWLLIVSIIKSDDAWPIRGQFGDMFGSVNALFSGLAFAGIIITILLQGEELREQRNELRLTRKEFKLQNQTLSLQRFENTFFALLQSQNEIVKLIEKNRENGRNALKVFYALFLDNAKNSTSFKEVIRAYLKMYKTNEVSLSHYFRNLYHIILFIDESTIETKYKYIRFIRATLSSNELTLLFYNCLSDNGAAKFKPLIEKYKLLKNMDWALLQNTFDLIRYDLNAYGKKVNTEIKIDLEFHTSRELYKYSISIEDDRVFIREVDKEFNVIPVIGKDYNTAFKNGIISIIRTLSTKTFQWLAVDNRTNMINEIAVRLTGLIILHEIVPYKIMLSSVKCMDDIDSFFLDIKGSNRLSFPGAKIVDFGL